ncbi:hypothetical protein PIB30_020480 [Stylosanthes scabra]|uniref:Uncharacterized protein n=1 Tax=Stylosanthes scabra TaxID=79078 RepID=A0ABU6W9J6_9FABA|nr:hypothetical protein [Stylosanthes scabra]
MERIKAFQVFKHASKRPLKQLEARVSSSNLLLRRRTAAWIRRCSSPSRPQFVHRTQSFSAL